MIFSADVISRANNLRLQSGKDRELIAPGLFHFKMIVLPYTSSVMPAYICTLVRRILFRSDRAAPLVYIFSKVFGFRINSLPVYSFPPENAVMPFGKAGAWTQTLSPDTGDPEAASGINKPSSLRTYFLFSMGIRIWQIRGHITMNVISLAYCRYFMYRSCSF